MRTNKTAIDFGFHSTIVDEYILIDKVLHIRINLETICIEKEPGYLSAVILNIICFQKKIIFFIFFLKIFYGECQDSISKKNSISKQILFKD